MSLFNNSDFEYKYTHKLHSRTSVGTFLKFISGCIF